MSGTLVYSPAVKVLIATAREGIVDISADLEGGQVTLNENQPHEVSLTILNHRKKYDGLFTPNDRIIVQMKRLTWLQTFSGYLTSVPFFSSYPRAINLTARCTLKRLQFNLWDAGSYESYALLLSDSDSGKRLESDGGIKGKLVRVLTEVGNWPVENIHIGEVPNNWFHRVADIYKEVARQLDVPTAGVGTGPTISGVSPLDAGSRTIKPSGDFEGVPGIGMLPATSGKISWFGGPNGGAYGKMALTGESGVNPIDPWYCAMQWPYAAFEADGRTISLTALYAGDTAKAKEWWKNRRILVVNTKNNSAVCLRAADWGPHTVTDRVIDVSKQALEILGVTDDVVEIRFAPEDTPLGPVNPQALAAAQVTEDAYVSADRNEWSIPEGITHISGGDLEWGGFQNGQIPLEYLRWVISPNGSRHMLHPACAAAYEAMRDAALRDGIRIEITDGYRDYEHQVTVKAEKGRLAAKPGTSNHGWGMTCDFGGGVNKFGTREHIWMQQNARRFGWVHPPWAQQGGSKPEAWHWEWWAGLNYTGMGATVVPGQVPGEGGESILATDFRAQSDPLLNTWQWTGKVDPESVLFVGRRALINDDYLLPYVEMLAGACLRNFCSAPNGDFIAWFPDYFGHDRSAGILQVETIEIEGDGFTMDWSDDRLITHQFTAGAWTGYSPGGTPGGQVGVSNWMNTMGMASVEFPKLMEALFNLDLNDPLAQGWTDPDTIFRRFGARKDFRPMGVISSREGEFWYACHLFMRNWSEQFSTRIPLTFMPEAFPGMLMQVPEYKFQAYITSVTHTFSFAEGGGFDTEVAIIAPASMEGGLYGLPRVG